ncbi:MAG TPA: hypothetical protein VG479_11975, partial [Gaiellaceae bacterium]|nr:hypothetical protein [Gaiellaceae bacterium]
ATAPSVYDQPPELALRRGGAETPAAEAEGPPGTLTPTPVARAEASGPLAACADAPSARTTNATSVP